MFGFDYRQGGPWNEKGIESMTKYFSRIERLVDTTRELSKNANNSNVGMKEKELLRFKNQTIKSMTDDIDDFRFNTAIARSMELLNAVSDYLREEEVNTDVVLNTVETLIKLLAPLAPHFAEEEWEKLGKTDFVYNEKWPIVNESEMNGGTKEIPVQVNGKVKLCVTVAADDNPEEILNKIKLAPQVMDILQKENVVKEIYIPGKIYNIVVKK